MNEFNEAIKELRDQFSSFLKDYYNEIKLIWIALTDIQTKQKLASIIYGGVSGIIFAILTALALKHLNLK